MSTEELHRLLGYTDNSRTRMTITWHQQSQYRAARVRPEDPISIHYRGDPITESGVLESLTPDERARGVKERARIAKAGKVYITLRVGARMKTAVLQLQKGQTLIDLLDAHVTLGA